MTITPFFSVATVATADTMVTTAVTTAVTTVATHPQQQGNILQGAGMTVNRRAYLSNVCLFRRENTHRRVT